MCSKSIVNTVDRVLPNFKIINKLHVNVNIAHVPCTLPVIHFIIKLVN